MVSLAQPGNVLVAFCFEAKTFFQQTVAPVIFGQKRQGEQDEVIKGYDSFREHVKKSVFFCVSVGISLVYMVVVRGLFSLFPLQS